MDGGTLQDRISRGMGTAARRLGSPYVVYRPQGPACPLQPANRIIQLCATFSSGSQLFRSASGYGGLLWTGVFDGAYTSSGDYLSDCRATYFIAAQRQLLPIQCVRTNGTITISRTAPAAFSAYSGFVLESAAPIISGWPACLRILHATTRGASPESRFGVWTILLPTLPMCPQVEDIINDDAGRSFSIAAAELSDLGWRLVARQISG
jgi:hypothetical protein